ncbi:hypothetical protein [Lichenifustis flavocetrariae]|uniref:Uncharacterized protein n=1 Tax=Lichenifustis flavocetrariae TaxID=2949735 RepID=A0AA42CQF4_9HYPH|nr:hypothetical protein [Lichenifustis flavocetrariae]MCW6511402.1 hypothetical protein [Lichenifustis flavocetrariae]
MADKQDRMPATKRPERSPESKEARAERTEPKICPECRHAFQGSGWDGIDAHWKAKHDKVMPYAEAWPMLKAGTYKAK